LHPGPGWNAWPFLYGPTSNLAPAPRLLWDMIRLMTFDWTRRAFMASSAVPLFAANQGARHRERYRAVSWWLTWEDLTWPNPELMDKIRRRADRCAASGVNCCLIFGAHLRWDFMPLWGRLHELLRYIADELHQRRIVLFDHHSSVITHRPRNRQEALDIWRRNRHHVPFYPSNETAATWEFNGSRMNDWRMLDVETGQPVYLPAYNAEQYCMNNPAFRDSYVCYVKRLLAETGIDGLMSDDGIFYAGWRACGCKSCRGRFEKQYGHRLPPTSDRSFWGNRRSQAFADWIAMRYETSGDFLVEIREALPAGFPLLSCCSSSDGFNMPAVGMSYQDFIRACNLVMLEMTGSTPSVKGVWDNRLPSQLLHLGIARENRAGCFGLGYGFFPDPAFCVWALTKFLGSDCGFSRLKGRLGATEAQLSALADDSELVHEGYNWEKANPGLFTGEVDAGTAVYFSRLTRDYFGQCPADYVLDYQASCHELMKAGLAYDVAAVVPQPGERRVLVLSSAACLSEQERSRLRLFLEGGGTIIATGPCGHYDQRGRPAPRPWLEEFGISSEVVEPERAGGFPPGHDLKPPVEIARCRAAPEVQARMRGGWLTVSLGKGRLVWRPERITDAGAGAAVAEQVQSGVRPSFVMKGLPSTWRIRPYRDGDRLLIHAIPARVETVLHPELRDQFSREQIIEKLRYTPLASSLTLETAASFRRVLLHSPDLPQARPAGGSGRAWTIPAAGVSRYFVLECEA